MESRGRAEAIAGETERRGTGSQPSWNEPNSASMPEKFDSGEGMRGQATAQSPPSPTDTVGKGALPNATRSSVAGVKGRPDKRRPWRRMAKSFGPFTD